MQLSHPGFEPTRAVAAPGAGLVVPKRWLVPQVDPINVRGCET